MWYLGEHGTKIRKSLKHAELLQQREGSIEALEEWLIDQPAKGLDNRPVWQLVGPSKDGLADFFLLSFSLPPLYLFDGQGDEYKISWLEDNDQITLYFWIKCIYKLKEFQ